MPEFTSSCYGIEQIENLFIKPLLAKKQAQLVHDSSSWLKKPNGMIDRAGTSLYVKRYYVVHVERDSVFQVPNVDVRMWFDKRNGSDKAGIKISLEGLWLIATSFKELIGLLQQLNIIEKQQDGSKQINIDNLLKLLSKSLAESQQ